jgi:hypothetical protein
MESKRLNRHQWIVRKKEEFGRKQKKKVKSL